MKLILPLLMLLSLFESPEAGRPYRILALGDSYTIGEAVDPKERWPVQLASRLQERGVVCDEPIIIATTGWRTDQLQTAIKNAQLTGPYDLVTLLIGVNNQYQGRTAESYRPEFEELLLQAIQLAGGNPKKVVVLSIPDWGFTPFGKARQAEISVAIDHFNRVNREVTLKHRVAYVDITGISRRGLIQPELVASDGLHPSGLMYSLWVDELFKVGVLR